MAKYEQPQFLHQNYSVQNLREYTVTNLTNSYNFSHGTDDTVEILHRTHSNFSETEKIIVGIVCSAMIIIVLTGNSLVVIAVCTFRHLHTSSNFLLLSLALADVTVASLVMTFSLGRLLNNGVWFAGETMCKLWMSLDVLCCTASILNLCMISLDKYWAITKPLSYKSDISKRRTTIMIAFVWVVSAVISFVPIFSDLHAKKNYVNFGAGSCSVNFMVNHYYAVLSAATSFYLPLAVMLFAYCHIYIIAHSQIKRIMLDTPRDPQGSAKKRIKTLAKEFKALRTLGLIMGCFIFCWLPFFLMYIIVNFCATCLIAPKVEDAITWLGYANSMINPLIYNFRHMEYRMAFRAILTCRRMRSLNRKASLAASASDLRATNSRRNSLRKLSSASNMSNNSSQTNGQWTGLVLQKSLSLTGGGMSIIPEMSYSSTSKSHSQEHINERSLIYGECIQIHHLNPDEEIACEVDV